MLPALPPATVVSPKARLAYVLRHFWQAYASEPLVSIGYADTQPELEVADAAGTFFEQPQAYPPEPIWHDWASHRLPFFFGPATGQPLLELLPGGRAHIHADLISDAFYLLSGWQEYYSQERDQHGRFPYAASVQHRYGFVAVPVVNYYFDILKTAVEHVTGQTLQPRRWLGKAPFATFITHDVDELRSAWKAPAKAALQRHNWLSFGQQVWQHLTRPDAWDNLELVRQAVEHYGAKSTFFFLPEHRKAPNGTPNADYALKSIQNQVRGLARNGAEVALHGSIGTSTSLPLLRRQQEQMPLPVRGNRFHYLYWEPRRTPTVLNESGISYDSTLGFAEHFGFRNSYCLPFFPYDFAGGRPCRFLEIPLNAMDATLHHPKYLQLAPEEILPALLPMFQEIERFGGVCTLLWHNDHFDPANETTGPRQFAELMQYLRSRHTAFVTGADVVSEWLSE